MSASLETPNMVSAVVDATDNYSGSLTEVQEFTVTLAQGAGTTSVDWGAIGGDLEDQEDLQEALDAKQDELTFDSTPTSGSTNPVTSGGVYAADNAIRADIEQLKSIGRFLSIWNCTTGLPATNPTSLPYTYKTGDYYRVGTVATGSYSHLITLAGTASEHGMHPGTYSVSFTITNQTATQFSTISAIAAALGEDGVTASGSLVTTDGYGTIEIVKVIEWEDDGSLVVALLDDTHQKMGLTLSSATTLTDSVSGGLTNYKPSGATYTGAASSTVESDAVKSGWVYYYDGTNWLAQSAGGGTWGSITGTLSSQTDLQAALDGKYDSIPEITIDLSQITSASPLTIQCTSAQATILEDDDIHFILLNPTAIGKPKALFTRTDSTNSNYIAFVGVKWSCVSNILTEYGATIIHYNKTTDVAVYSDLDLQEEITFDASPVSGSTNPVTSGGLYTVLAGKQKTLIFDSESYTDPFGTYSSGAYNLAVNYVT